MGCSARACRCCQERTEPHLLSKLASSCHLLCPEQSAGLFHAPFISWSCSFYVVPLGEAVLYSLCVCAEIVVHGSVTCSMRLQAHMEPGQTHDFCVTLEGSKAMAERAAGLLVGSLPAI